MILKPSVSVCPRPPKLAGASIPFDGEAEPEALPACSLGTVATFRGFSGQVEKDGLSLFCNGRGAFIIFVPCPALADVSRSSADPCKSLIANVALSSTRRPLSTCLATGQRERHAGQRGYFSSCVRAHKLLGAQIRTSTTPHRPSLPCLQLIRRRRPRRLLY